MDLRIHFLKTERKLSAEQAKILRKYEKHCQRHNALQRGFSNSLARTQWDTRREDAYAARKALGKRSRYMGLARGYALGKDYAIIENSNKPNNQPSVGNLYETLLEFGFKVDPVDVTLWLER